MNAVSGVGMIGGALVWFMVMLPGELHDAVKQGDAQTVGMVLQYGPYVHEVDDAGKLSIDYAIDGWRLAETDEQKGAWLLVLQKLVEYSARIKSAKDRFEIMKDDIRLCGGAMLEDLARQCGPRGKLLMGPALMEFAHARYQETSDVQ